MVRSLRIWFLTVIAFALLAGAFPAAAGGVPSGSKMEQGLAVAVARNPNAYHALIVRLEGSPSDPAGTGGSVSYTDAGLASGTYLYRARAVNGSTQSAYSAEFQARVGRGK